jgi:UDP-N-acetylmuramoyl-L-alanyl-D-glutamate--2,6-diaminopimelate ligase
MRLDHLAPEFTHSPSLATTMIQGLTADSREVLPGYLFAALAGSQTDGRRFVEQAVARGAVAVLTNSAADVSADIAVLESDNPRRDFARMASRFFALQPPHIGAVTGTNGKTSTVRFLQQILTACGHRAASMGTLGVQSADYQAPLGHTTPDPVTLSSALRDLVAHQMTHVALEASSHGLDQHRLDGVRLEVAGFTNLSRDHMDYHGTEAAYLAAKQRLFCEVLAPAGTAVVLTSSDAGEKMAAAAHASGRRVMRVGTPDGELYIDRLGRHRDGLSLRVHYGAQSGEVTLPLIGDFQIENLHVAVSMALVLGCAWDAVLAAVETLQAPEGRLQKAGETQSGAAIYIDYAHTPDALANTLASLRAHMQPDADLHLVFGCGGDRDVGKRPLMGEVAARMADHTIITDDNPRHEKAHNIRREILAQCPQAQEIGDRGAAIEAALAQAQTNDFVLVAGKGHETGQVIGDTILPFKDVTHIHHLVSQSGGRHD